MTAHQKRICTRPAQKRHFTFASAAVQILAHSSRQQYRESVGNPQSLYAHQRPVFGVANRKRFGAICCNQGVFFLTSVLMKIPRWQ